VVGGVDSQHKAYEMELEASIAELESINKLLEDEVEEVQKKCEVKLAEQNQLLSMADEITAQNTSPLSGSTSKLPQTQTQTQKSDVSEEERKRAAKLHEEQMAQLRKEYEAQLDRKGKELEDVKAQVGKTRKSIIDAAGDQAVMMENVINEAEQLVEAERAKFDEILLKASAKHKLEMDSLHASLEADQAKNNKEFKRLEAEMETVYAKHQKAMEDTRHKHAKALDMVEKSFEEERAALEADVEAERAKAAAQVVHPPRARRRDAVHLGGGVAMFGGRPRLAWRLRNAGPHLGGLTA